MVLISIQPFGLRKILLVVAAMVCFSAICLADPVLMVHRYAAPAEQLRAPRPPVQDVDQLHRAYNAPDSRSALGSDQSSDSFAETTLLRLGQARFAALDGSVFPQPVGGLFFTNIHAPDTATLFPMSDHD
jgi:hypothetical protein